MGDAERGRHLVRVWRPGTRLGSRLLISHIPPECRTVSFDNPTAHRLLAILYNSCELLPYDGRPCGLSVYHRAMCTVCNE